MAFAVTSRLRAALLATALLVPGALLAAGRAAPFKPPASTLTAPALPSSPQPLGEPATAMPDPAQGLLGIRRGARSAALMDGTWVDVGQTARSGARLVSVTALGAHLIHPDGRREFLALSPQARWSPHRSGTASAATAPVAPHPLKEKQP